jgi:hypothetical protein
MGVTLTIRGRGFDWGSPTYGCSDDNSDRNNNLSFYGVGMYICPIWEQIG